MGLTSPTTRWTRSTPIASQRLKMLRGVAGPEAGRRRRRRRREMGSPLRGTMMLRRWRPSARLRTGTQKSRLVFDILTQGIVFLVAKLCVFRFALLLSVQGGPGLLFRLRRSKRERSGAISSEDSKSTPSVSLWIPKMIPSMTILPWQPKSFNIHQNLINHQDHASVRSGGNSSVSLWLP